MSSVDLSMLIEMAGKRAKPAKKELRESASTSSDADQSDASWYDSRRSEAKAVLTAFLGEDGAECVETDAEALQVLDDSTLLDKALKATVPLQVGSSRFKGAFVEPLLLRTVCHGFVAGWGTGDPVSIPEDVAVRFGDRVHTMYVDMMSSADVCDLVTTDEFRVVTRGKVVPIGAPQPCMLGFHYKGKAVLQQVDGVTWVAPHVEDGLGPGDSGAPVLNESGHWVLHYIGHKSGLDFFARSTPALDPVYEALLTRGGFDGVDLHRRKGRRGRAQRMTQVDYEKRRAAAEKALGRKMTPKELNEYFYHEEAVSRYIEYQERAGGRGLAIDHDDEANVDTYHEYDDDGEDSLAGSDPSDFDAAIGAGVHETLFGGGKKKSRGRGRAMGRASRSIAARSGVGLGSERDPKVPRLDDDEEMTVDAAPPPPPAAMAAASGPAPEPSFPPPQGMDEANAAAWAMLPGDDDRLELLMMWSNVPEVARQMYRKLPFATAYGAITALKKKAPLGGPLPDVAALKPPTKASKAADARQAEIAALKAKKELLEKEGFKLRDVVVLTEQEKTTWPVVTHEAQLLRKQIKVLEAARSAKMNFQRRIKEREEMAKKAQAQVDALTAQLSALRAAAEEASEEGKDF